MINKEIKKILNPIIGKIVASLKINDGYLEFLEPQRALGVTASFIVCYTGKERTVTGVSTDYTDDIKTNFLIKDIEVGDNDILITTDKGFTQIFYSDKV